MELLGIALPFAAALICFFVALMMFLFTDNTDEKKHKALKIALIVSGAVSGVMLLAVLGLVGLAMLAMKSM